MSNARGCLEAIKQYGITKFWTGHAFVWDVATLDNNGCSGSLTFANEQDANAYVVALRARCRRSTGSDHPSSRC